MAGPMKCNHVQSLSMQNAAEISGGGLWASCDPMIIQNSQGDDCETPAIAGRALRRHALSMRNVAEISNNELCVSWEPMKNYPKHPTQ